MAVAGLEAIGRWSRRRSLRGANESRESSVPRPVLHHEAQHGVTTSRSAGSERKRLSRRACDEEQAHRVQPFLLPGGGRNSGRGRSAGEEEDPRRPDPGEDGTQSRDQDQACGTNAHQPHRGEPSSRSERHEFYIRNFGEGFSGPELESPCVASGKTERSIRPTTPLKMAFGDGLTTTSVIDVRGATMIWSAARPNAGGDPAVDGRRAGLIVRDLHLAGHLGG